MSTAMHPAAPHHLPAFIAAPGETDYLLVGSAVFLLLMVLVLGTVYFRLHALPEHLAHRNASKLQFEVVAVLALLALFTHNNTLWIAALLLALVPIPDLYGPLARMADALAKMAGSRRAAAETSGPVHDPPGEVPERSPAATSLSHGSEAEAAVAPTPDVASLLAALYGSLARMADAMAKMVGWRRAAAETSSPLHDPAGVVPASSPAVSLPPNGKGESAVAPTPDVASSPAADGTKQLERA
jgi:hypothetical protein